jgi:hypothetical protein
VLRLLWCLSGIRFVWMFFSDKVLDEVWVSLCLCRGSQVDYGASLENWFPNGSMGSNPIPCATNQIPCVFDTFIEYLIEVRENALITAKNKQIIINALSMRVSNLLDSNDIEQHIQNCACTQMFHFVQCARAVVNLDGT